MIWKSGPGGRAARAISRPHGHARLWLGHGTMRTDWDRSLSGDQGEYKSQVTSLGWSKFSPSLPKRQAGPRHGGQQGDGLPKFSAQRQSRRRGAWRGGRGRRQQTSSSHRVQNNGSQRTMAADSLALFISAAVRPRQEELELPCELSSNWTRAGRKMRSPQSTLQSGRCWFCSASRTQEASCEGVTGWRWERGSSFQAARAAPSRQGARETITPGNAPHPAASLALSQRAKCRCMAHLPEALSPPCLDQTTRIVSLFAGHTSLTLPGFGGSSLQTHPHQEADSLPPALPAGRGPCAGRR